MWSFDQTTFGLLNKTPGQEAPELCPIQKQHVMGQAIASTELQQPLGSGFNARSTAAEVIHGIDLTGKVAIVTGGYAGIGLETTRALAGAGATVIAIGRDPEKARKGVTGIPRVEVEAMDLMDPASIDAFAERFLATGRPLHLLINNAGIMWVPLRRDGRGYESQLATNHLGHFQLTARLWPALKQAMGARVINVSSFGHQTEAFDFEDPNFERGDYESLRGYGRSKTANILFAVGLDARGKDHRVRAFALHPGAVGGTDLAREASLELFQQVGIVDVDGQVRPEVSARLKTMLQGAATSVWCATSPLLNGKGGVYCEDADVAEVDHGHIEHRLDEPATMRGVRPYALDAANAERLWTLSERLTGVAFPVN